MKISLVLVCSSLVPSVASFRRRGHLTTVVCDDSGNARGFHSGYDKGFDDGLLALLALAAPASVIIAVEVAVVAAVVVAAVVVAVADCRAVPAAAPVPVAAAVAIGSGLRPGGMAREGLGSGLPRGRRRASTMESSRRRYRGDTGEIQGRHRVDTG